MRFKKWIGVRHAQVLMFAVLIFLDIYQEETAKMFTRPDQRHIMNYGGKFVRVTRSFTAGQLQFVDQICFLSFAVGRTLCSVPIMRLNNKYLTIGTVLVEAAIFSLFEYLVILFEYLAYISMAAMLFFLQSAHYPLAINIIAKWIPPNEYTRAVVTVAAGDTIARSIVKKTASWSNYRIMTKIFYLTAILKTVWSLLYMVVGAQDPQTSFLIRKAEWDLLSKEIGPRKRVRCGMKIPWKKILSCPRLYALICSEMAYKWYFLAVSYFRTYCPEVNIDNAELCMVFQPFTSFGFAWFLDSMISKYYITRNNARKIGNTIALWGGAVALAFMCYSYRNRDKMVFFLFLSQYLALLIEGSHTTSIFDLSPNYATVIFCLYMIPVWASLIVRAQVARVYTGSHSCKLNLPIYYRAGLLMFVLNYAFLMCGSITLLKFDSYDTRDWRKESVISYP